ncbi:MAG: hypothetical protein AAFW46_08460 [Pseudomonadota bacterium]
MTRAADAELITLNAEIREDTGPALDPERHEPKMAGDLAKSLCDALVEAYRTQESARPETLAVAAQTMLETLLSGFEAEGVGTGRMRVALANSLLVNGHASVSIDVTGASVPSFISAANARMH